MTSLAILRDTRYWKLPLLILVCLFFLVPPQVSKAAGKDTVLLKEGFYLIAGAFSSMENVSKFSEDLKVKGYTSEYAYSHKKKLFYSILSYGQTLDPVMDKYTQYKKLPGFTEVWILKVHNNHESKIQDMEPVDEAKPVKQPVVQKTETKKPVSTPTSKKTPHRDLSATHHTYHVLVNLTDENNKPVAGFIKVIQVQGEHEKVLANMKSAEQGKLHIPKRGSQTVQLMCEEFGYHKTVLGLPLDDPIALSAMKNVKVDGANIKVDFVLQKCQKGDIMVMMNVFFHSNSNIMRLKSEEDLQVILAIMKENPTLRIMVHGHTNGNSSGPITQITDSCDNFFAPTQVEHTKGSSMKLSLLRAEAIRMYLMKNGITGDRIEVKGWGGKKMIYKEDSPHYQLNVRVEIEVLDI